MTSTPEEFINGMPMTEFLGMEITDATDGRAIGELPFRDELTFDTGRFVTLHGAASFALADNVGAAAIMSYFEEPRPAFTIDMRIDYLSAATSDLRGEAEVIRFGDSVGVADISVEGADGEPVVVARGSYRTG